MDFFTKIYNLLDTEQFDEARILVDEALNSAIFENELEELAFQIEIFGILCDIGCESRNEKDINRAIEFFETKEQQLGEIITKSSYYYILANAKNGLAKNFHTKNRGVYPISLLSRSYLKNEFA